MYELINVGERTWYMSAPTNVGFYLYAPPEVCIIDIGDRTSAENAIARIRENGWKLTRLYLTHSHADHVAGAAFLRAETGCEVFAPGVSAAAVKHNFLVPTTLYGGSASTDMHGKLLMPPPCECAELNEDEPVPGLKAVRLDGHDMAQAVFGTTDGVWFTADTVISAGALEKHRISFIYNIAQHLESLDALGKISGRLFIPAHDEPCADIRQLVGVNRSALLEVAGDILKMCETPQTIDDLIAQALEKYHIRLYLMQYLLVGQTVRSYVSWLLDNGRLKPVYEGTRLYFISEK